MPGLRGNWKRALIVPSVFAIGGIFGWYAAGLGEKAVRVDLESKRAVPEKTEYRCVGLLSAGILEAGFEARAFASKNDENVAIRIDPTRKKLYMMTSGSVSAGRTDPGENDILIRNENLLVATSSESLGQTHSIMLEWKTGRLMWTKSADILGLMAMAHFFECR